ncbi:MAG: DUF4214 domain-containing protein [Sulfitobacter sp.]|nr:DUF4214 domain-containing protein [Sulfitobacter sp.]
MATIELAGRRVGGDIGIGAGHLALFYRDDAGQEFILSAYTDNNLFVGDLYIQTHEGSAWVPRDLSDESLYSPALFDRVLLDFGGRDPEAVAAVIEQQAVAINELNLSYSALTRNSNSVIGSLLDLVGIDVDEVLPNPPDVGWLGFVARNELFEFAFGIDGSDGADLIRGRAFEQRFVGEGGDDTLIGGGGEDTLTGNAGDDMLNGGDGRDLSEFSGAQTSYTLTLSATEITVTDRRAEGNGTDRLMGIELLDFDTDLFGAPFDLDVFGRAVTLDQVQLESLIELYIACFNRAPDAVGLNFWATAHAVGLTLEEMAKEFTAQSEFIVLYPPGTSNSAFVASVYDNVLGRLADPDGSAFWTGLLDSGALDRDEFVLRVLEGAKAAPKPEMGQAFVDQQNADRAYLETKTDIGAYFAVHKGMSDAGNGSAAMALYDGSGTGVTAALTAIDGYYAEALDPARGEFLMPLVGVLDHPFDML